MDAFIIFTIAMIFLYGGITVGFIIGRSKVQPNSLIEGVGVPNIKEYPKILVMTKYGHHILFAGCKNDYRDSCNGNDPFPLETILHWWSL